MQQAIPYKSWPLPCATTASHRAPSTLGHNNLVPSRGGGSKDVRNIVLENAVIVFARKGCCMSHVVRRLLLALGVNPAVYEIDDKDEVGVLNELEMICNGDGKDKKVHLPAVFIGGRLFGGLDKVMATHISGELVPVLKDAGALWL
ncbi:glutaredoxin-C9-like [Herrania umbratica]|uniref:Glutaredoxin-C9-like n=1 Tax=Herrania umbratica TaxID=108875 RepID=A0A6J1AAH8_9ROSI|nr:glutaredoxin-C9-like [Herrania umbratica]